MSVQPLSARIDCTRRASAKPNCPGASARRAGRFGKSAAAARSAVVMNRFSAGLRQAMKHKVASLLAASRRFANAWTGSEKNITPKRDMIMSKLAGSNAWVCASAQMNFAGTRSCSARTRAVSIICSEISTPTESPLAPSSLAMPRVVLPVPQPTSSTRRAPLAETAATSRSSNGSNIRSSNVCASTHAQPALPFQSFACSSCLLVSMTALCHFKSA